MIHYIETQTKDGTKVRIEVEFSSKTSAGFTRQAASADLSSEAVQNAYAETLDTIRGCANGMLETLQKMTSLPSAATIDFAIKIDAEAGPMIAKARDEGQFRVSLTWKQPEPDKDEEKK
jgi:hypothetical protein